jgi:hypothetical protein
MTLAAVVLAAITAASTGQVLPEPASAATTPSSRPSATTIAALEPAATKATAALASPERIATGTYRLEVEVAVATPLPIVGVQRTTTRTVSHVTVDDAGVATAVACTIMTQGPAFISRMPPSSVQALPPARFPIVVEGARVRADMGVGTVGWRGGGDLPRSAEDPRLIDVDGDGIPGLRMDLDLGALGVWVMQIVTRGHTILEGALTEQGAAGGLSRMESEQQVLSGLPVDIPPSDGPVRAVDSVFRLSRVPAKDCTELQKVGPHAVVQR